MFDRKKFPPSSKRFTFRIPFQIDFSNRHPIHVEMKSRRGFGNERNGIGMEPHSKELPQMGHTEGNNRLLSHLQKVERCSVRSAKK